MSTRDRVEQCPRCELRFPTEAELRWHLGTDHDATAAELAEHLEVSRDVRRRQAARARTDRTHRRIV